MSAAVDRLAALLYAKFPLTLGEMRARDMAEFLVAAGWLHPDSLTDAQIQALVGPEGFWKAGGVRELAQRAGDFRAALRLTRSGA